MILQRMMLRLQHGAAIPRRSLHTSEQLRWVIDRERARADRTSRVFSLLIFSLRDAPPSGHSLRPLVDILQDRLRCYDEIGQLDTDCLAVVLPDTPGVGAWKVADDVLAVYPTDIEPPQCVVYTYPSNWDELAEEEDRDSASWEPGDEQEYRPVQRMESLFERRMPWWKRGLDVVGAVAGLILFLPVIAAAAWGVRWTSPGPVFFKQWRAGAGNRRFLMYKLRTMHVDAERRKHELMALNEQDGPAFKIKHDPRITPLGRWLRRTSIDELPQFWNVLKGDMSLVGPRPLPCDEASACEPWQKRRLDVTPGLTCIWQVQGRSQVSFDDWVRMDVQYIRSRGALGDVKLILQTVVAVLSRRGAH